jgi:hypothetical protein
MAGVNHTRRHKVWNKLLSYNGKDVHVMCLIKLWTSLPLERRDDVVDSIVKLCDNVPKLTLYEALTIIAEIDMLAEDCVRGVSNATS